jgi:hypothetical protein
VPLATVMILNSHAVLLAFVGLLRLTLGLLVLVLGVAAWRAARRPTTPDDRDFLAGRFYLLFLMALLLLGLNLVSWPLLYLLLQSYVPEFPGVMCIYGVTRIGEGSTGPARHLPDLLRLLQATKPALVFVGGGWFVLYLLNRRCTTAPLLPRLLVALLPLGALAVADAAAELAYVAIPKAEEVPTGGCCTGGGPDDERFVPKAWADPSLRPWLYAAFYGGTGVLVLALFAVTRHPGGVSGPTGLTLLFLGAVVVSAVGSVFLVDVAAPAILRLPYHHCPYDLVPRAPDAIAAVTLFVAGGFFLGWAWIARFLGQGAETAELIPGLVTGLLRLGLWSYLAAMVMVSLELVLA